MADDHLVDNSIPASLGLADDARRRRIRRFATAIYVGYALILLAMMLWITPLEVIEAHASLLLLFLLFCLIPLGIIAITFFKDDRGLIELIAGVHLAVGVLVLLIVGDVYGDRWGKPEFDLKGLITALLLTGSIVLGPPAAVLVAYFKESKAPMPKPGKQE